MRAGRFRFSFKQEQSDLVVRPHLLAAVSFIGHFTGLSRLIGARYRGRGMIFVLHSVVDDEGIYPDQGLRCSVRQLERALRWLRGEKIDFVDLDEAVWRLRSRSPRPFACFT